MTSAKIALVDKPDFLSFSGNVAKFRGKPYGLCGKRTQCCRPLKEDDINLSCFGLSVKCKSFSWIVRL